MIEFEWPWMLLALPIPMLIIAFKKYGTMEKESNQTTYWWSSHALPSSTASTPSPEGWFKTSNILLMFAWISLVVAIARPIWVGSPTQITPSGRDLFVALDLSGSMQISDMYYQSRPVNRLVISKHVLSDFIEKRKGDRIGVIVFGTKAYLQAPLSFDTKTVRQLIQETQIGFAGEKTAIGDAIGLGIKQLSELPSDKKVLILMTDGANTAGRVSPLQAANFAAEQGVTIHTIGIGADEMEVQGFFGPQTVNPSEDLDEALLENVASLTGGKYYRAKSTSDLEEIYGDINNIEPTPSEEMWQRPKDSLFIWFAILSGLLTLGTIVNKGNVILRWRTKK
ncbi:VWA domain-containing protein [Marinomonas mediterranea]|uniref:VWA domain-containing protein n=1 Tax=Marinomonas mediterranea TaxID=119864 RepID=UPI002349093A|nr:VWA domain-containing protein [Marinomonas mediterranea]WCN09756.1 VWA domain-containing protein [Marinomonas mediterranea]WCN13838.1 VWA domain-containing protein [Marinomonas mediterranea]